MSLIRRTLRRSLPPPTTALHLQQSWVGMWQQAISYCCSSYHDLDFAAANYVGLECTTQFMVRLRYLFACRHLICTRS